MYSVAQRSVVASAPSKVNLFLGVGPLREDGFHELSTIYCALSLRDTVTISPAESLSISVKGESHHKVPTDETNLAWKAAVKIAEITGISPDIHIAIDKGIPVAGGMAGGSADAAATLVACNRFFDARISSDTLYELAAELGSDVPFSLRGGTATGSGRGEALLPIINRSTMFWVLGFAKEGLSTPKVFAELDRLRGTTKVLLPRCPSDLLQSLAAGNIEGIAHNITNELQVAALSLQPELRRTLHAGKDSEILAGIVSGSGPTCAFLCEDQESAREVATELSSSGTCRAVRVAHGPVGGTRLEHNQGRSYKA